MREGSFGLSNVPELVKRILRDGAWKERAIKQTGEMVTFASRLRRSAAAEWPWYRPGNRQATLW